MPLETLERVLGLWKNSHRSRAPRGDTAAAPGAPPPEWGTERAHHGDNRQVGVLFTELTFLRCWCALEYPNSLQIHLTTLWGDSPHSPWMKGQVLTG